MPQIANQDYNVIELTNILSLTSEEKALIRAKVNENTILDFLLHDNTNEDLVKVIGLNKVNEEIFVYSDASGAIIAIDFSE